MAQTRAANVEGRRFRMLVGRLCLLELVAWGILYYAFSAFIPVMEAELGWSAAQLALGFSLALLVSGLAAPLVGGWIDRHGSRELMVWGSVAGSLGVALWAFAYTLPVYLAAWTLVGFGMAGTLYAPAFATLVRVGRGQSRNAILMVTVVGALASTVFLPVSSLLSELMGWRAALGTLAVVMAGVTIPLALALPKASEMAATRRKAALLSAPQPKPLEGFWILTLALMLAGVATIAINVHLVVFLVDQGQPLHGAASIAGIAGLAKMGGRLAIAAGGRFSSMALLRMTLFLKALALLMPLLWPSTWAFVLMVIIFGATSGARTVLRPAILEERYGSDRFGRSNGLLQLFTTLAKASGPVGFGVLLGLVGWAWAWPLLALLVAISGILLCSIRTVSVEAPPVGTAPDQRQPTTKISHAA